jgi:endogenous inhibitor of DNA gyrase (YacG/DUF329 family)
MPKGVFPGNRTVNARERSWSWDGGLRDSCGYLEVLVGNRRYAKLHRLLMERRLGRSLRKGEVVHHVNGNKRDNSDENLVVMSHREHAALHAAESKRRYVHVCAFCGLSFLSRRKEQDTKRYCSRTCSNIATNNARYGRHDVPKEKRDDRIR